MLFFCIFSVCGVRWGVVTDPMGPKMKPVRKPVKRTVPVLVGKRVRGGGVEGLFMRLGR